MTDLPDDLLINVIQNQNTLILHMVEMLQAAKTQTPRLTTTQFTPTEGANWRPWVPAFSNSPVHALRFETSNGQTLEWDSYNGWRS